VEHAALRTIPACYKSAIFHVIEHMLDEFSLVSHRGRELAAHLLNGAAKYRRGVKFFLRKAMVAKPMSLGLEHLCELFDLTAKVRVLFARDDAHAALSA
jgi:hypothetical protein